MSNKELFTKNMLKISDVAEKLGVERYVIFEKMTLNADLLDDHVHKIQSLRYIDDEGIALLSDIINADSSNMPSEDVKQRTDYDKKSMNSTVNFSTDSIQRRYTEDDNGKDHIEHMDNFALDIDIFCDEKDFIDKLKLIENECLELENIVYSDRQLLIELDKSIMKLEYEIRDALQQKKMIVKSKESKSV